MKCKWCSKKRPDTSGICPHCHRFPPAKVNLMRIDPKSRKAITDGLFKLSASRHSAIPLKDVANLLELQGIKFEDMILCGEEGRCNIELYNIDTGQEYGSDLILSWLKGHHTYEVTLYLS